MKAMGHRSMASLLTVVLNAAWYAVAIFLALIVVLVLAGANVGLQIGPDGPTVETGPNVVMAIRCP